MEGVSCSMGVSKSPSSIFIREREALLQSEGNTLAMKV